MNKVNLKDILIVIRDTVKRNRVAYKDYLGSETVTKTNIIVEGILVEEGTLTLKDSSVTSFVIGESYDVTIDGVTEVMIAYDLSENSTGYRAPATNDNIIALGNVTDLGNLPSDGWVVAINDGTAVCKTLGSYIGKSISISQTKTITEKHYDIKKLPDELLPNTVAKKTDVTAVKKLATNAQTLAETAQATADNAQTTADNAQSTAEVAQSTAEVAQSTAEVAQATADNAQTTAQTAQTTANNAKTAATAAQTTANAAKTLANAAATKENPVFIGSFSQNRKVSSGIGDYSHAEGNSTTASGNSSHSEGHNTTASGYSSHAEGTSATASGRASHAEGDSATASGNYSHAEGNSTTASGNSSHSEGDNTTASGYASHAEGYYTKACSSYQHVQGKYNIEDSSNTYAHIVGNGNSDNTLSNAHTLDWSGNAWFAGTVEGTALIVPSSTEGSTKKFKITVDDNGTPSLTNAEDSAEVWSGATHSAYAAAQAGGYTDTQANFYADLAAVQGLASALAAI